MSSSLEGGQINVVSGRIKVVYWSSLWSYAGRKSILRMTHDQETTIHEMIRPIRIEICFLYIFLQSRNYTNSSDDFCILPKYSKNHTMIEKNFLVSWGLNFSRCLGRINCMVVVYLGRILRLSYFK